MNPGISPFANLLGASLVQVLYLDVPAQPDAVQPERAASYETTRADVHQVPCCVHLITDRGLIEITTAGRPGEYGMQIRLSDLRCTFHENTISWPAGESALWKSRIGLVLADIAVMGETGEGYCQTIALVWPDDQITYLSAAAFVDAEESTVEWAVNRILITDSGVWAAHFGLNQIPFI